MKPLHGLLVIFAAALAGATPALAQQKRVSPHETISTRFGRDLVIITYGRPYSKKPGTDVVRKIWGDLVPWGKVWRAGSDEATTIIFQKPLIFGDTTVPGGAYTLFMLPNEDGTAKLIINKEIGQWGIPYLQKDIDQELVRLDMKKETLDPQVDQFTMAIAKTDNNNGSIQMMWETSRYSIDFKIQH
jgi:DUF2911 family protein